MAKPGQTSLSRNRAGNRWQPSNAPALPLRVAGRRALRVPRIRLQVPEISVRWRMYAAVGVTAAAVAAGAWGLYQSSYVTIRSVGVQGASVLPPDVVRTIADLEGQPLFQPGFAAAEQRLTDVSLIKSVRIERTFPMGARITIVERQPWGYWQIGQQRLAVDSEGVIIDLAPPQGAPLILQTDQPTSPFALGDQVDPGAVAVAAQLATSAQQTLGRSLVALEYSNKEGLTAVLEGDVRAVFGDYQGYEFKLATLAAILQKSEAQGTPLHRVDLRFGDRVAVS